MCSLIHEARRGKFRFPLRFVAWRLRLFLPRAVWIFDARKIVDGDAPGFRVLKSSNVCTYLSSPFFCFLPVGFACRESIPQMSGIIRPSLSSVHGTRSTFSFSRLRRRARKTRIRVVPAGLAHPCFSLSKRGAPRVPWHHETSNALSACMSPAYSSRYGDSERGLVPIPSNSAKILGNLRKTTTGHAPGRVLITRRCTPSVSAVQDSRYVLPIERFRVSGANLTFSPQPTNVTRVTRSFWPSQTMECTPEMMCT